MVASTTFFVFLIISLAIYDAELRRNLSDVLNIDLSCESAWCQATLPVAIGICKASQLAPSAFLASAAGFLTSSTKFCLFSSLVSHTSLLMPPSFSVAWVTTIHLLILLHLPYKGHGTYLIRKRHMISSYSKTQARLLAAATKESAWSLVAHPTCLLPRPMHG